MGLRREGRTSVLAFFGFGFIRYFWEVDYTAGSRSGGRGGLHD